MYHWAVGRRKAAVARVRLKPNGTGLITANDRPLEEYFQREMDRMQILKPLHLTGALKRFDVLINVRGGGIAGQAGACRHGVSRALATIDPTYFRPLKEAGMLTRDARKVERKKPGRKGARGSFQFSKR